MDFSEAVQWWEEWQLRVLALSSLFLQYFLYLAAPLRKNCIPSWLRFIIWLAYLGSDAVAIYALAALFNRQKKQEWFSTHREDASLEALWAPILLVHLGGVDAITAYNIEDNELWRRYVLTSVSQAAVAIYVFRTSWTAGNDKRLLQAAILVFLAGILKCVAKPVALKSASISSLMSISSSTNTGEPPDDARMNFIAAFILKTLFPDVLVNDELYYPFVDRAGSKLIRGQRWHEDLRKALSLSFDRLYTKEQVSSPTMKFLLYITFSRRLTWRRIFGYLLRAAVNPMIFTALGLFHSSKEAYNSVVDVKVTYTLLSLTAGLEYIGALLSFLGRCIWSISHGESIVVSCMPQVFSPWPDHIAQYNLIGYLASKRKHRILTSITGFLGCEDYLDPLWCMEPCKSSTPWGITECVGSYIENWMGDHESEAAANRAFKFTDSRGHWTVNKELGSGGREILRKILLRPFDESVLLWHLTTEFCYFDRVDGTDSDGCKYSRVISNYMAYLLFLNPEMLMTGASPSLFRDEYKRLKDMPLDDGEERTALPEKDGAPGEPTPEKAALRDREEDLAKKIIQKLKGGTQGEEGVADAAWALSKELMDLYPGNYNSYKMWELIKGVWVEMLCFSASRCRGYLHAKSLGKGGEYLSYIWLLLPRMGMETVADKMKRAPDLPELQQDASASGGGTNTTSATPAETTIGDENEKAKPQEEEISHDGAACTTPATTVIADDKIDENGGSHGATTAAAATPVIGDENV